MSKVFSFYTWLDLAEAHQNTMQTAEMKFWREHAEHNARYFEQVLAELIAGREVILRGNGLTQGHSVTIVKADTTYHDALVAISKIQNKTEGPDWEEIEEARSIAKKALGL